MADFDWLQFSTTRPNNYQVINPAGGQEKDLLSNKYHTILVLVAFPRPRERFKNLGKSEFKAKENVG